MGGDAGLDAICLGRAGRGHTNRDHLGQVEPVADPESGTRAPVPVLLSTSLGERPDGARPSRDVPLRRSGGEHGSVASSQGMLRVLQAQALLGRFR